MDAGLRHDPDSTDDDRMRVRSVMTLISLTLAAMLAPTPATAQWRFGVYMGGNHTKPADIHIVQPAAGMDVTYSKVGFDAEPFKAPQYYGWRFSRGLLHSEVLGVELEFTHLKMFART